MNTSIQILSGVCMNESWKISEFVFESKNYSKLQVEQQIIKLPVAIILNLNLNEKSELIGLKYF